MICSKVFCWWQIMPISVPTRRAKRSTSVARDYGTNLLGAMVGGVGEYLSLVTGFRALLIVIAICYVAALAARQQEAADVSKPHRL